MANVAESLSAGAPPRDWARIRFTSCVGFYGGAVGAAAVLVNTISLRPYYEYLEHLPIGESVVFGIGGALGGLAVSVPFAYWLFGRLPYFTFYAEAHNAGRRPRTYRTWVLFAVGFAITYPLVMGGVFLPLSFQALDFYGGVMSVPDFVVKTLELPLLWLSRGIVVGVRLFFTGLVAGAVFASGGWLIDAFNASRHQPTARYAPWVIAAALATAVLAAAAFTPGEILHKLG